MIFRCLYMISPGHIASMSSFDHKDRDLSLLSTVDLEGVAFLLSDALIAERGAKAVAVLMWDSDFEALSDRFIYGPRKKDVGKLIDTFYDSFEGQDEGSVELNLDELGISLASQLKPVVCHAVYGVRDEEQVLVACIIVAGAGSLNEVSSYLATLPISPALSHAWEVRELKRENARLRSSNEENENIKSMLEELQVKLLHDIGARDSIRTNAMARERLVYLISNVVRSSVNIQTVLETTVEKIATTFSVSRVLLLRSVDGPEQLDVCEFINGPVESVKEVFFSEEGRQFTLASLGKTTPHDIWEPIEDERCEYRDFLVKLGIRSGLIIPLIMRERVLGVLFLQDCVEPRTWSIDEFSLIGSLADNLAVAIENAELHAERERQAVTDGLTGVANRRSFNENFAREFERAKRYGQTLSLVIIDLDFLKRINDNFGHQAGDEAIKAIGTMLRQSSRSIDLPARYGGEEFCLLLPNTDIVMAEQLAERLRRLINDVQIEGPGRISASLGVASYPLHADDPDSLFLRADEALYAAKQAGRNQVKIACSAPALSESGVLNGDAADRDLLSGNTPGGNSLKGDSLKSDSIKGDALNGGHASEGPETQAKMLDLR